MPNISKSPIADPAYRRIRGIATVGLCVLVATLGGGRGRATPPSGASTHTVVIETMRFSPASIKVLTGDRIDFKNTDLVPHTVTSTAGQSFDSGTIEPGQRWRLTGDHEGEIAYSCTFHPTMKGS